MNERKHFDFIVVALILAILALSINTLTKFPDPYDDEGMYAAFGAQFVKTGSFNLPEYSTTGPYASGSAVVTRLMTTAYGILGHFTGYNLASARAVSMLSLWLAAFLWFFISRRVGINGWLGVLLFVSTERLFYASHAFRPEVSLVLANTFFISVLTKWDFGEASRGAFFGRGLINFLFVAAHGNGVTSVVVNCFDMLMQPFKSLKKFLSSNFFYYLGSFLAAVGFYFIQLHFAGGFGALHGEVTETGLYHTQTVFHLILSDIQVRWGRELVVVGGSTVAKIFRFYFYFVMVAAAVHSSFCLQGLAKRSGRLTLVCIVSYMFLVWDKIDIHFAEMMPFFLFSFMSWIVAVRAERKLPEWATRTAFASIILIGLALVFHHGIKYQGKPQTQIISEQIDEYLRSEKVRPGSEYKQLIGQMKYWFWFHDRMRVFSDRYAWQHTPFHGGVIVTDGAQHVVESCHLDFVHPDDQNFSAFYCP